MLFISFGTDPSHQWVLTWAVSEGMKFGSEIIFTYGPLGTILRRQYTPESVSILFPYAFVFWTLAIIFLWRAFDTASSSLIWKGICFLGLPLLFYLFRSPDPFSIFILYSFLLRFVLGGPLPRWEQMLFHLWAAILVWTKVSLGLGVFFTELCILGLMMLRRGFDFSILVFPLSVLLIGFSVNHSPVDLILYFQKGLEISTGFSAAMSIWGSPLDFLAGLVLLGLITLIPFSRRDVRGSVVEAIAFLCSSGFLIFLIWKQSFVRHDAHALTVTGFALFALPFLGAHIIPAVKINRWFKWVTTAGIIVAAVGFHSHLLKVYNAPSLWNFAKNLPAFADSKNFNNLWSMTLSWDLAEQRYHQQRSQLAKKVPLTDFKGTVDLYEVHQGMVLANELDYHPRPIFQSYSAYTPKLVELNRNHLLYNPPSRVYTLIDRVDNRFPMLDDGLSFPEIWANYQYKNMISNHDFWDRVESEESGFYLKEKVLDANIGMGEWLELPKLGHLPLWVEMHFSETLAGKVQKSLIKSPEIQMTYLLDNGNDQTARIIPGIARMGFLLNPYVLKIDEHKKFIRNLEEGTGFSNLPHILKLRLDEKFGFVRGWQPSIRISLYHLHVYNPSFSEKVNQRFKHQISEPLGDLTRIVHQPRQPEGFIRAHPEYGYIHFAHAPSRTHIRIPEGSSTFSVSFGLMENSWLPPHPTDGVEFRASVKLANGSVRLLETTSLDPRQHPAQRSLQELSSNLPEKSQSLILETRIRNHPDKDWSFWTNLHFE